MESKIDNGLEFKVSYLFSGGSLRYTSLKFNNLNDVPLPFTFATLTDSIDFIPSGYATQNSWIFCDDTLLWIRVPNDSHLNNMIRSMLASGGGIHIQLQDSSTSPNSSPHGTPSAQAKMDRTYVNNLEPFTPEDIPSFDADDLVMIPSNNDGGRILVSWRNLLQHINAQLASGVNLFSSMVNSSCLTDDGEEMPLSACLTRAVWQRYLLRNHKGYEEFLDLYSTLLENFMNHENNLKDLHENKELWMRLKIYHHDLRTFGSNSRAENRLCSTHHPFFMNDCYFDDEERRLLLNFPTSTGLPLHVFFGELQNSKSEICSSHDVAPVIEKVFGIRKGYEKEKSFGDALKRFNNRH